MKFKHSATLLALVGAVVAKDEGTFAVLRFTNKQLTKGRMDPIVSPAKISAHVHTIMGGSNFGISSTGETITKSQCTNAQVKGDNSNYWFPSLYFHDESASTFEPVDVFYTNVYYLRVHLAEEGVIVGYATNKLHSFEATNDEIKAFPTGLQVLAGDAMARLPPKAGAISNLDPSNGPVQPVKWTCPRNGNHYNPPSWPADSDGFLAGIGDPVNMSEGVGFPDVSCDGYASPLRADIHFPSCYNPEAGLTSYSNNMAYPEGAGSGKVDCPEGWIHVPHLFLEVYWNTPVFDSRWTPNTGKQPFVLSNGDATGYSSHADFMAGWDEELLQHIIDTCNTGTSGMDNCPGLFYGVNDEDCTIASGIDEKIGGKLNALPGSNPVTGWRFGGLNHPLDPPAPVPSASNDKETSTATSTSPAESDEGPFNHVVENLALLDSSTTAITIVASDLITTAEASTSIVQDFPSTDLTTATFAVDEAGVMAAFSSTTSSSCEPKVHTVWETVTVTTLA
jgi:hypothetical protein